MGVYDMEVQAAAKENAQDASKKVSFRFCRECSNMLYPLEDQHNHKLMFACRSCQYSEEALATCIYRNSLKEEVAETAGNVQDVAQDPTVGSFDEMDYESGADALDALCTMCGSEITCPTCGGPSDGGIMLETIDPSADDADGDHERIELERRERTLSGARGPTA